LVIVLSGLLRFTDNDYPFGIFKRFLQRHLNKDGQQFHQYQQNEFEFEFWYLTPLSTIFQLYHGDQF